MTQRNNGPARRVGTFSMGVALIASGVCGMFSMFFPWFDWVLTLRLSPLILVLLGGEILYSHFSYREGRMIYDFFSMFLCLFLIAAAFGMMAFYAWAGYHGFAL